MNDVMRFTVVDAEGAVSFVAPCEALPALVAACSRNPRSLGQFLAFAGEYYPWVREYVEAGLAVFDEHNTPGNYEHIHQALARSSPREQPVFRVVDEVTREASLRPARAGVVLFNLSARRIVQIQNTYAEIRRVGRVRVRAEDGSVRRVLRYQLPVEWTLVP